MDPIHVQLCFTLQMKMRSSGKEGDLWMEDRSACGSDILPQWLVPINTGSNRPRSTTCQHGDAASQSITQTSPAAHVYPTVPHRANIKATSPDCLQADDSRRRSGRHRLNGSVTITIKSSTNCATTLSRMNLSGYVGHVTILSRMFTIECSLVVGLGLGLGLGLVLDLVSGW